MSKAKGSKKKFCSKINYLVLKILRISEGEAAYRILHARFVDLRAVQLSLQAINHTPIYVYITYTYIYIHIYIYIGVELKKILFFT